MPRGFAEKDRYIETVSHADKYEIGDVIRRWGKRFRITRIVESSDGWQVYGIEV